MDYTYHIVAIFCYGLMWLIRKRIKEYRKEIGEIKEQSRRYEDHGV